MHLYGDNVFKDAGDAQSSNNWRLIMTYFNMIKIIESTGIGLVYGLQFYGKGQLNIKQMVIYVQVTNCFYAKKYFLSPFY